MAQINVNTENLLRVASYLDSVGEDMTDNAGKVERVKGQVETAWKSSSTGIYTEEIDVVKSNINKISREATGLAGLIREYVAEVKRTEQEAAQSFNG